MRQAPWDSREWSPRDVVLVAGLLIVCGLGMVFRRAFDLLSAVVSVPGPVVAVAFAAYCVVVAWMVAWLLMNHAPGRLSPRVLVVCIAVAVVGAAAVVLLSPESLDARADRDEALDGPARALLAGDDPWAVRTQLGQIPSPLLGGILLALPFVAVLGSSAWQSVFWLAVGALGGIRVLGARPTAAMTLLLLASPVFVNELVFQGDVWVNAAVLAFALLWAARTAQSSSTWTVGFVLSAALFGFGLADRFFFACLVLPAAVWLARLRGRRFAIRWSALAVSVAVLLVAVPWAFVPGSMDGTWSNVGKATSSTIPYSGALLAVLMIAVGGVLAWRSRTTCGHWAAMAVALLVLPLWEILTTSLDGGELSVSSYVAVAYLPAVLVFGVLAAVLPRTPAARRS